MPPNKAAWLMEPKARPLEVGSAPYTRPEAGEVVIRAAALAVNPVDWVIQSLNILRAVPYPAILGRDVAGTVEEVGEGVGRFRAGDRVLGHAISIASLQNKHSAFQQYVVVPANCVAPIPDAMPFERAAVVPLGTSTAAFELFDAEALALPHLPQPGGVAQPTGETVLVWGGTSSVGSCAVQLARAAGYEVFTTASPRNTAYAESLGAARVFDYGSASVEADIVAALEGRRLAGAVESSGKADGVRVCAHVVLARGGRRTVATVLPRPEGVPDEIATKDVFAAGIKDSPLAKAIYEDFLPAALADGSYVPAPEPLVVGNGLDKLQEAMDIQKQGVSAKKVVVLL